MYDSLSNQLISYHATTQQQEDGLIARFALQAPTSTRVARAGLSTGLVISNPVSQHLQVKIPKGLKVGGRARVLDLEGRALMHRDLGPLPAGGEFRWEASSLSPGAYLLVITGPQYRAQQLFIKQ